MITDSCKKALAEGLADAVIKGLADEHMAETELAKRHFYFWRFTKKTDAGSKDVHRKNYTYHNHRAGMLIDIIRQADMETYAALMNWGSKLNILDYTGGENTVTQDSFNAGVKCLIDNGIDEDEAEIVLQALCYILTGEETEQYMSVT